jgi:hypothetical protein
MRTILVLVLGLGCALGAQAGEWQKSADTSLNLTQSAYSDTWTGSELGAVSWTWNANLVLENQLSPRTHFKNDLKLQFGQSHQQVFDENGDRAWDRPRKANDRIFDEALLKLTLGGFLDPYAAVTVETQFYDGKVRARKFSLDPLQVTEAVGGSRTLLKNDTTELATRLGFGLRQNRNREVDPADPENGTLTASSTEGGLECVTDLSRTFGEDRLKIVSKLRLFQALFNSRSDELEGMPNEDDWKKLDVAWETTLSASISKYIQTTLFFELLYDKEISADTRWRQTLGLGVSYKLF